MNNSDHMTSCAHTCMLLIKNKLMNENFSEISAPENSIIATNEISEISAPYLVKFELIILKKMICPFEPPYRISMIATNEISESKILEFLIYSLNRTTAFT